MNQDMEEVRRQVEIIHRVESRRILATLIRLLKDFDLAEEAMQDAFRAAMEQWPKTGIPRNPRTWLVSTGRFKAIDSIRRRARFDAAQEILAEQMEADAQRPVTADDEIGDDRLRLIFTCCHPALAPEARTALTLREVCGLTTEEIARAFLVAPPAMAQRIVRAKNKIREARIPYQVPTREDLPYRLDTVLQVVYLIFNEGYYASSGDSLTRAELSGEAIRLGRLLWELLPEAEVAGLLALMLLQESRRAARMTPAGDIILLEDQDRSLWNRAFMLEGLSLLDQTGMETYGLQAKIAGVHARGTDWHRIVELYDRLFELHPSPVIELNRAVAVAMRDGADAGITLIAAILNRGDLTDYHLAHAALADLYRRLGQTGKATKAYEKALQLAQQEVERRFLQKRLQELSNSGMAERP
ncbi:MAG TPA: RNA polymerase sigma factor [Kiritimatiellia bacterium]|nr:RNA polymerase sigma factor [Kiritimatiellia bacterium]